MVPTSSPNRSRREPSTTPLAVVYRPIAELHPDPRNARQHSKKQLQQIANSIQTFGFLIPVLVDQNLAIVAGHGRVQASQLLGHTQVPTISVSHLTPAQVQAYRIADNRLAENATWDDRLLAEQLQELSLLNLDFSLEAVGFTMGEIDLKIQSLSAHDETEQGDAADALPAATGIAVSVAGDLWQLGAHRLLCGNALEEASYAQLMGEELADMVLSDLPYNVKITGHVCGKGAIQHREFAMAAGEMSEAEFTHFLTKAFTLMARHSHSGSIHFQCIDWRHLREILAAGQAAYTELKNLCVWDKGTGGMGSLYRSQHELVFVFKNGSAPHVNNVQLGKYGRNRTNVWKYPGANSFARDSEEGNLLAFHPTAKPVALVSDAILDCSDRNSLILDAFLGAGTTLIAAEKTGRVCRGMELDPLYVDTAIRRWQTLTGKSAIHVPTGQTFAEREAELQPATEDASLSVLGAMQEEASHGTH